MGFWGEGWGWGGDRRPAKVQVPTRLLIWNFLVVQNFSHQWWSVVCEPGLLVMAHTGASMQQQSHSCPNGRVFTWNVTPFGVSNAPALLKVPMKKVLYILRQRPLL